MTSLKIPTRGAKMDLGVGVVAGHSDDWLTKAAPMGFGLLALVTWVGGGLVALVPRFGVGEQVIVSVITACSGIALAWIGRSLKIELAKLSNDKYHNKRINGLEKEIERLKFLLHGTEHEKQKPSKETGHDFDPEKS